MHDDLDPAAARAVNDLQDAGIPPWRSLSVSAARTLDDDVFGTTDPPPVPTVRDLSIDGPGCELPIRLYRPSRSPASTLVFYHGGGFVVGTLDSVDGLCRRLCRRTPALVLSMDYRLAPEHPFPAPVEDAAAALSWAATYAERLGGNPDRFVVAGTSAGANLATAVTRRAVRDNGPGVDEQILAYPMLAPGWTSDDDELTEAPLLDRADVSWFWTHYLRSSIDRVHPYAAPLRAESHEGLPPTTVLTAGVDVLGPEGEAYADALAEDGVKVEHDHYPGQPHGFLSLAESVPTADGALDDVSKRVAGRE
jgi:acetyl esterase